MEATNQDFKTDLRDLYITSAQQIDVTPSKNAIIIHVPYRLLKGFQKIQQRLVRELEKKFSGKDVVLVANRRIMPKTKSGSSKARPRSRTLTSVSWIDGVLCLVATFVAFVIVLCQGSHELLFRRSQAAVYVVTQVTEHHFVHCLPFMCSSSLTSSAKMYLPRCICSSAVIVVSKGDSLLIRLQQSVTTSNSSLVLLVAHQYKPKRVFLVVSLHASSKDSLFSSKQRHCSSSKLSAFETASISEPVQPIVQKCTSQSASVLSG